MPKPPIEHMRSYIVETNNEWAAFMALAFDPRFADVVTEQHVTDLSRIHGLLTRLNSEIAVDILKKEKQERANDGLTANP